MLSLQLIMEDKKVKNVIPDSGRKSARSRKNWMRFKSEIPFHLMLLPSVIVVFIFSYIPLYGLKIAFEKFNPAIGLFGDNVWIGLKNFAYIFSIPNIWGVFGNTLSIAIAKILIGTLVALRLHFCLMNVKMYLLNEEYKP